MVAGNKAESLTEKADRILGKRRTIAPAEPRPVNAADRKELLAMVERVLEEREIIERRWAGPPETGYSEEIWKRILWSRSFELYYHASKVAADLLGPIIAELALPDDGNDASGIRLGLLRRLRLARPLVSLPLEWTGRYRKVLDELNRLGGGDEPEVFAPPSRARGQSPRPMLVAQHRLRALAWAEHLRKKGIPTAEWKLAITRAYGAADWDTIRKWRVPCEEMFGESEVASELRHASNQFWGEYDFDNWRPSLDLDGFGYLETWREERSRKR